MTPSQSASAMQAFLASRGISATLFKAPQLIESVLEFYRSVRASGLAKGPQSDMLLFQWGVYDWGMGESFEFDLTRQFISASDFGDGAISQLRCTAHFAPTPALRGLSASNRWCSSVADIEPFSRFIYDSTAFRAIASATPVRVTITWSKV